MKAPLSSLLITIGAHRKKPDMVFYAGPIEMIPYPHKTPVLPEQGGAA